MISSRHTAPPRALASLPAPLSFILTLLLGVSSLGREPREPYSVPMLSPAESMATIRVPEGFRLELVASEPMIEEPVAIAWDAEGRMYVAEMRTYMQDIDGRDQMRPISRVSLLEDTDNDGKMDKHTVFADKLVLPRMILPLDGRVLIRETNTFDLYSYRDTDGDGVADEKLRVHEGGRRGGNLEHQPSGLVWNLDNWIYTTYSRHRYRFTRGKMEREALPHGSGQWGNAKEDVGNLYYSTAGGEQPAMDFQQPFVYGQIRMSGELAPGFKQVFPLDDIPDTQGGRGRLRSDNTLNHFTGCGGQGVFRGDRLPEDLRGDLFIPEAVGRLIRRAKIRTVDGKTVLENAYHQKEFIASSDPNFRPLGATTGPDGCLYIVDMYRGIIQEGSWVRPGSYLRKVVEAYDLDKNIGKGRIYRLVHEDFQRGPRPRLLRASSARLTAHLSHPNGWWRDTAQKLLVLRGDREVVPSLMNVAREGDSPLARLHALWTLEGLDVIDTELLVDTFRDGDARVRAAAIRISERLLPDAGDALILELTRLADDPAPSVLVQLLLTAQHSGFSGADELIRKIIDAHAGVEAFRSVNESYRRRRAVVEAQRRRQAEIRKKNERLARSLEKGQLIYSTLCVTCHGENGRGKPSPDRKDETMAPSLVGSPRVLGARERLIRILLHGLSGPVDDKAYTEQMVPMGSNSDIWISDVINHIRNSWGNGAAYVSPNSVGVVRKVESGRRATWTLDELQRFDPRLRDRRGWKLSASHNDRHARSAIDGNLASRWATETPQVPGMWFSIEIPQPERIYSIVLDSTPSRDDYPVGFEVRTSVDGKSWGQPIAAGRGPGVVTRILFDPIETRFLKVTQTGRRPGKFWSIHDLQLLKASPPGSGAEAEPIPQLPPLAELLQRSGNADRGRLVFEKSCTLCHQVADTGVAFGPNLSEVGSRLKKPLVYQSILQPNAVVDDKFRGYLLQLSDGSFVSGFISKEDKENVTIALPGGKTRVVKKAKILFRQKQETSFMPADLEKAMNERELVDLVEFLLSRKSE